ncbi:MAG: AI-2E family transporter [Bacteroidetes bacterium]|nr:AI-2E family transporter [Bacteroidota bacterium]
MRKYRSDLIFFSLLTVTVIVSYYLVEIVLPFFLGLGLAYLANPIIKKIQGIIPSRNIAVTIFFVAIILITTGSTLLFARQIANDFSRLNKSFRTYAESNKDKLDETTKTISTYIEKIYDPEKLKQKLNIDSLNAGELYKKIDKDSLLNSLDIETIKESFAAITSFFTSGEEEEQQADSFSWFFVLFTSILYFVYINYEFGYFEDRWKKYFDKKRSERVNRVVVDFRKTFVAYFKQRGKIVLIYMIIYTAAFFIIGLPGALVLGIIAGLLCFVPYLQYLTLIPISLGCLVLSMETNNNYFIYFGIILGVFILSSLLEELLLYPKIMNKTVTMNPVIIMLSLSVWGYLFGLFGVLIALPLTSLVLSYVKQILLYKDDEIVELE